MRLRRMRRRFSSSSAAMAGEISDAPNSGSVADRSCAKLGFVILRCFENVHQLFVSDVIPVLVEFLVGCTSGPAGSGAMDWRPAHGAGPSPFSVPYHALNPVERRIAIRFAPAPQLEGDLANLLHSSHLHRSSTPQERPAERRCPAKFLSLGLNVPRA